MDTNDGRNHLFEVVNDFNVAMLVTHTCFRCRQGVPVRRTAESR